MEDEFRNDVRARFDQAFGIERLPLFSDVLKNLEEDGHHATAEALRALIKESQNVRN